MSSLLLLPTYLYVHLFLYLSSATGSTFFALRGLPRAGGQERVGLGFVEGGWEWLTAPLTLKLRSGPRGSLTAGERVGPAAGWRWMEEQGSRSSRGKSPGAGSLAVVADSGWRCVLEVVVVGECPLSGTSVPWGPGTKGPPALSLGAQVGGPVSEASCCIAP